MKINETKIKKILLEGSYVSEEDLQRAEIAAKEKNTSLVESLFSDGILTKDLLGQAISEYYKMSYADLNSNTPNQNQVLKIPEDVARNHRIVLFYEDDKEITLATDSPETLKAEDEILSLFPNKKVIVSYSLTEDLEEVFSLYRKPLETRFAKIIENSEQVAPDLLNEIFEDALGVHSSDIHFEPREKKVIIRFRVDGLLREAGKVSKEYYENILNKIKVQSHLRIDKHFSAQDGAIRYLSKNSNAPVDMRVSIIPNLDGEKVVIRLLSSYVRSFTLDDLGLSEINQKLLLDAGKKPSGMILVTGPTGSGKSTTLYALLKILSKPETNVMTIEDPVEYRVEGINQIQVNQQTELTFARGLRSIVRQDPDIILVGEIRDGETAEIAVNAALTGHLLLSTFHSNDAASSIPRLLDMEIEPFLLSSTLELIIAQRLVRKICEKCRYSYSEKVENIVHVFDEARTYFNSSETLYKGKGCDHCNGTGFKGRTAIFEFVPINREMKDLILKKPSTQDIWRIAEKSGARDLFKDGVEKVKKGITTIEELLRVASPVLSYDESEKTIKKQNQKRKRKVV